MTVQALAGTGGSFYTPLALRFRYQRFFKTIIKQQLNKTL